MNFDLYEPRETYDEDRVEAELQARLGHWAQSWFTRAALCADIEEARDEWRSFVNKVATQDPRLLDAYGYKRLPLELNAAIMDELERIDREGY